MTPPDSALGREKLTLSKRVELLERDREQQSRIITEMVESVGKGFSDEQLAQIRAAFREELADAGLRVENADQKDEARKDFMFMRRFRLSWEGGATRSATRSFMPPSALSGSSSPLAFGLGSTAGAGGLKGERVFFAVGVGSHGVLLGQPLHRCPDLVIRFGQLEHGPTIERVTAFLGLRNLCDDLDKIRHRAVLTYYGFKR